MTELVRLSRPAAGDRSTTSPKVKPHWRSISTRSWPSPVNKGSAWTAFRVAPVRLSADRRDGRGASGEAATAMGGRCRCQYARPPRGGDRPTDQASPAGSRRGATNTYYWVRLMRLDRPEGHRRSSTGGLIWPNQRPGAATSTSPAARVARHAPTRPSAIRFLEYSVRPQAHAYFADGNQRVAGVKGVRVSTPRSPRSARSRRRSAHLVDRQGPDRRAADPRPGRLSLISARAPAGCAFWDDAFRGGRTWATSMF